FLYNNLSLILTFSYACITWIFFRANSFDQALTVLKNLFTTNNLGQYFYLAEPDIHGLPPSYLGLPFWQFCMSLLLIPFLFLTEWLLSGNGVNRFRLFPWYIKWASYYAAVFAI